MTSFINWFSYELINRIILSTYSQTPSNLFHKQLCSVLHTNHYLKNKHTLSEWKNKCVYWVRIRINRLNCLKWFNFSGQHGIFLLPWDLKFYLATWETALVVTLDLQSLVTVLLPKLNENIQLLAWNSAFFPVMRISLFGVIY